MARRGKKKRKVGLSDEKPKLFWTWKCHGCGRLYKPFDPKTGQRVVAVACSCGKSGQLHKLHGRDERTVHGHVCDSIEKKKKLQSELIQQRTVSNATSDAANSTSANEQANVAAS